MVPMCIADRLAKSTDERVRRVLGSVTFHVVPVVNPDGYEYSWTKDRYWRKNRHGGHGVDLNRNFNVGWGGSGSSGRRSSQTYRGEHPFSEAESQAMRDFFVGQDIAAHLDFHSYSQLILYPWSHQRQDPEDRDKFAAISDRMTNCDVRHARQDIPDRAGADLRVGASGTFMDWTYGDRGALSLTVELRPEGGPNGFVLPPDQIVPTCDEGYAGDARVGRMADQVQLGIRVERGGACATVLNLNVVGLIPVACAGVVGLVAVAVLGPGCVDTRSNAFTCNTDADCDAPRVCQFRLVRDSRRRWNGARVRIRLLGGRVVLRANYVRRGLSLQRRLRWRSLVRGPDYLRGEPSVHCHVRRKGQLQGRHRLLHRL